MKKIWSLWLCLLWIVGHAQNVAEGVTYCLPKTAIQVRLLVEKTVYTPGDLAAYGEKYLKLQQVAFEPTTTYRVVQAKMLPVGIADTAKQHTVLLDKKHSIIKVDRNPAGILLAINATGKESASPKPFVSAPKATPLNPRDFMNADILSAGSKGKMAALIASDIYEIRDSRNQLTRGEADFMPKDGEQLRLMMDNLNRQEQALLQEFKGTTVCDTAEVVLSFVPQPNVMRHTLCRFSDHAGILDANNVEGRPLIVHVQDLHQVATFQQPVDAKKSKEDIGVYVNLPRKIKLLLYDGNILLSQLETPAGQFGRTEAISSELFGKKFTTHIRYDAATGSAIQFDVEPLQ